MLSSEQAERFEPLLALLSPENLTCDGELSRRQINKQRNAIMKKWYALEKELGFVVSDDDVYRALGWM